MKYVGPRLVLLALWLALPAGGRAWAGGQGSDTTTKGSVLEDDWADDDGPPVKRPPKRPPPKKQPEQKPAGPKSPLDEEEGGRSQVFDDDDDAPPAPKGKGGKAAPPKGDGPKTTGKEGAGKEGAGKDRAGKDRAGKEAPGDKDGHGEGGEGAEGMQLKVRYRGVAPGQSELPPNVPKKPVAGQGPQQMTWPGFQVKNGQANVFFQLSGPVEYSVGEEAGSVTLTLHDTVVSVRNNLHPLLVEEFNTPVKSVRIDSQRKKKLVRVSVMVKGQVAHRERLEQGDNGYSMLIMEVMPLLPVERAAPPGPAQSPQAPPPNGKAPAQPPPAPPKPHDPFDDD